MRVELDTDETWALLSALVKRVAEDPTLTDEDRARIRRWRSERMKPGSETTRALTAKVNDDLARTMQNQARSQIQKSDWR
ncbi:MAG: hypothetical protein EXR43_06560 [Dehalococcoidia bacterium]|nr:hypothetical protein [Dehalococcoidia bacterium]